MKSSYHIHSTYSDGAAGISEIVAAARSKGFTSIGISDHLVLHPQIPSVSWAMPLELLDQYVAEVRQISCRERKSGMTVLLGLEVDWFPASSRAAELEALMQRHQFDYLIGSVHFVERFAIDSSAADWAACSTAEIDQRQCAYWQAIADLARHGRQFCFLGHLDLVKKFNYHGSAAIQPEIDTALQAIADSQLLIEINTAGWDKPCGEAYPSAALLQRCAQLGIGAILSDDAHCPADLGRHYVRAQQFAAAAGVTLVPELFGA